MFRCPLCHTDLAVDEAVLNPPPGQIAYVECPQCNHRDTSDTFSREWHKHRKAAEREIRRRNAQERKEARKAERQLKRSQDREEVIAIDERRKEKWREERDKEREEEKKILADNERRMREDQARQIQLEANRVLNDLDIASIHYAIESALHGSKNRQIMDWITRGLAFIVACANAVESSNNDNWLAAIYYGMFACTAFWFAFRR